MEGLNDEMSMQLMVATFNNYQELVDKALMMEGKQQQIESRKRKYGQGKYNSGAQQKPRFSQNSGGLIHNHGGHTHNGGSSHNHNGPKNGNGNEQAAIRTALTQPHPPRRIKVTLPVSSAGRLDTMRLSALR